MENPASKTKKNILITNVESYLGKELASHFLKKNNLVWGVTKHHLPNDLILNSNFTLLDINLGQPLPSHLPEFETIIHIASEIKDNLRSNIQITPVTNNVLTLAHTTPSRVLILAPIKTPTEVFEHIVKTDLRKKIKIILVGDIYGPNDQNIAGSRSQIISTDFPFLAQNQLEKLITQALKSDKIILEKEGTENIYPTYIEDAIEGVFKINQSESQKLINLVVSQEATSSLSASYEIQKIANITLGKNLGLYFHGPPPIDKMEETSIKIPQTENERHTSLEKGLKKTLEYYLENGKANMEKEDHQTKNHLDNVLNVKTDEVVRARNKNNRPMPKKIIKRCLLLVLVVFAFFIAKTCLDLFLGYHNLKKSQEYLFSQNFDSAQKNAIAAAGDFRSAENKLNLIAPVLKPLFKTTVQSTQNALNAAETTSRSLAFFSLGSKSLVTDISQITTKSSENPSLDLESPSENFLSSYNESQKAISFFNESQNSNLVSKKVSQAEEKVKMLSQTSQIAYEFTSLIPQITGVNSKKTYLLLLLNNTELRPGGGFIGNYATISFENGTLSNIKVDDIYNIDGQLKETIEPPKVLTDKLGVKNLYLRDSNWSPDNEVNSQTARDFFKKETGQDVDGVITMDLTTIQNILKATGPIKVPGYKDQITSDNLFEKGEYYAEIGFTPGSTQKRDFFGALTNSLLSTLISSLNKQSSQKASVIQVFSSLAQSIQEKHLMLSFQDPQLATYVKTKGWNFPLPPESFDPSNDSGETRDFLSLTEANIGANKVNYYIKRNVDYDLTIGRDADLVAKVKITYKNECKASTWPCGTYVNFLRVTTPNESSLLAYKDGNNTDITQVESQTVGNLKVFQALVEIPPKNTKTIEFNYRIPKNIKLESAPIYHLYIEKQAGTGKDPLTFSFNLPAYLVAKSMNGKSQNGKQNITVNSDLSTDREFIINIAKK